MTFILDLWSAFLQYLPLMSGAYIAFLLLRFPDLTIEASWSIGAITVCLWMLGAGDSYAVIGLLLSFISGALCGLLTFSIFSLSGYAKLLSGLISYWIIEAIGFHLLGNSANIYLPTAITKFSSSLGNYSTIVYSLFPITVLIFLLIFQYRKTGIAIRAVGENPFSHKLFAKNFSAYFLIGLILTNAIVALGGGLWASYYGSASNVSGIGIVLKAFFALLIGDELLKAMKVIKRSEPIVIPVGTMIFVLLNQSVEYISYNLQIDFSWIRPTDKQIIISLVLIFVLRYRRKSNSYKKEVTEW